MLGCSGPSPTGTLDKRSYSLTERVPVEPRVGDDWIGFDIGASPGEWFHLGTLAKAPPDALAPSGIDAKDAGEVGDDPDMEPDAVVLIEESGDVFSFEMDVADLSLLAQAALDHGWLEPNRGDLPSSDQDVAEPELIEKDWSSGTDNRVPRGLHEIGMAYPESTVGYLSSGCTAAFVLNAPNGYHVITAAHCLFQLGSGAFIDPFFTPREDHCEDDDGNHIFGCDNLPYGAWDGTNYMTYQYFVDNCRGLSPYSNECRKRDIALVRVTRPSGEGYPGSMGFGYFTGSTLSGLIRRQYGYPNCGGVGAPDAPGGSAGPGNVCRDYTLYGDLTNCSLADYHNSDSNGENRNIKHGCDVSGGMSGGPFRVTYSGGAYIFGVHISQTLSCFQGSNCSTPNTLRRITNEWLNAMSSFMGF